MFMTENLIKRYLLEQVYNKGKLGDFGKLDEFQLQNHLYNLLKMGNITIDEKDFEIWLTNLKKSKKCFGEFLRDNHCIDDEEIIEITEDESISSVNEVFSSNESKQIIEQVGNGCYGRPNQDNLEGNLVINGIYDNQMIYLAKIKNDSSFAIGYCGNDSLYTQKVIDYYKNLRNVLGLMFDHRRIEVLEEELEQTKIYLLTYK